MNSFLSVVKSKLGLKEIFIVITCLFVIVYLGIKIYKEVLPESLREQQLKCLELGSDMARKYCLILIKKGK